MGGYGSGRPALRAVIDQQRRFDVRRLRKSRPLLPGTAGVWTWTRDGDATGQMQYRIEHTSIEFRYRVTEDESEGEDVCIVVPLRSRRCRFGGSRAYMLCPCCFKAREVIVMTTSGRQWGCRTCLRLRYQSQRLAPADRMQRRADTLYDRAGTDYGEGMVLKRKWMRWRTFNRLMDRANNLSSAADAGFLYRLRRFGYGSADELLRELG